MSNSLLWDAASDLEGACGELEQLQDVLTIYSEHLDAELDFAKSQGDAIAKYLSSRCALLRSLMSVAQTYLSDIIHSMQKMADAAYVNARQNSQ